MATTLPELQILVDELTAQVATTTSVEASAVLLLDQLGAFMQAHAGDAAAIEALGVGITNADGDLETSANALAAAIVANTPVA